MDNRFLYKIEVWLLKTIPFVLALLVFLQTILNSVGIYVTLLSYVSFVSYIPLLFLYVSSYVFKFCNYHRIPMYYILCNNLLNTTDLLIGIPITDYNFILMHSLLFGFASILCGILKLRNGK